MTDKDKIDITESKIKEKQYETIIHTSMDGFWLVDKQGNIVDVNNSYCKMVGYSREELLKMKVADLEACEKPEDIQARVRKIMDIGHDYFETSHKCKDNSIIDIEISVNYLKNTEQIFVFMRDITYSKKVEKEQLKHIKELEVFYKASISREERILELKKEVERLKKELNEKK